MTRAICWCLAAAGLVASVRPASAQYADPQGLTVYHPVQSPFSSPGGYPVRPIGQQELAPPPTPVQDPGIAREIPQAGPYSTNAYGGSCSSGNCGNGNCNDGNGGGAYRAPRQPMCYINDQYEPEWYVSAMGGFQQPRREDVDGFGTNMTIHPDGGMQGGVALGWATGPTWLGRRRVEVEIVGRKSDLDSLTFSGAHFTADSEVTIASGMVNVLWDFKHADRDWYPYLGGGVGVAHLSIDDGLRIADGEIEDSAFAYQFIGGISWRLRSYLELFAEARYFGTGTFEDTATNSAAFTLPNGNTIAAGSRNVSTEYHAFNTMIGLRIILGKRRCVENNGPLDGRPAVIGGGWHFTPNP